MKTKNIISTVCLAVLLGTGSTASAQKKEALPELIFAYSTDVPLAREQAQVATIVYPENPGDDSEMFCSVPAVDGVQLWGRKSPVRRYRTMMTAGTAIDVLPGKHTVSIDFTLRVWVDKKKGKYANITTGKPADVDMEFEAGCVYRIRPIIADYNLLGFAFDKVTDDESLLDRIAQSRSKAE